MGHSCNHGLTFTQQGNTTTANSSTNNDDNSINMDNDAPMPGLDGRVYSVIQCYACNRMGHYTSHRPYGSNQNTANHYLTIGSPSGFSFSQVTQQHSNNIPKSWILLDNQLTVDVFCNASLLHDIHASNTTLDICCNAGVSSTSLQGTLARYGLVCYHPTGIANILSLSKVCE